jgi:hypothetical protein
MSVNIELPLPELALLRQMTRSDSDAEAVVIATREYLRLFRLRELKSISGKVELNGDWQKLEELELAETAFPQ